MQRKIQKKGLLCHLEGVINYFSWCVHIVNYTQAKCWLVIENVDLTCIWILSQYLPNGHVNTRECPCRAFCFILLFNGGRASSSSSRNALLSSRELPRICKSALLFSDFRKAGCSITGRAGNLLGNSCLGEAITLAILSKIVSFWSHYEFLHDFLTSSRSQGQNFPTVCNTAKSPNPW